MGVVRGSVARPQPAGQPLPCWLMCRRGLRLGRLRLLLGQGRLQRLCLGSSMTLACGCIVSYRYRGLAAVWRLHRWRRGWLHSRQCHRLPCWHSLRPWPTLRLQSCSTRLWRWRRCCEPGSYSRAAAAAARRGQSGGELGGRQRGLGGVGQRLLHHLGGQVGGELAEEEGGGGGRAGEG